MREKRGSINYSSLKRIKIKTRENAPIIITFIFYFTRER